MEKEKRKNEKLIVSQSSLGQFKALRGHVYKHNTTTDKNLRTRDWRGAFSVLTEHRRKKH